MRSLPRHLLNTILIMGKLSSYKLFHLNDMQASTLFLLEVLIKFNDVGSNPVEGRTKH
jgi:hypothetical protein